MEESRSAKAGGQYVSTLSPDVLTGLLERAVLSEEHCSLMSAVLKKISSATSGLNEAFTSLLRGFEVCSEEYTIFWL